MVLSACLTPVHAENTAAVGVSPVAGADALPVYIGLDAEFDYPGSTSAEAIKRGMLIAMEEINQRGGVLGGRPLALLEKSNHSMPARSLVNIEALAANPDVAAIFCGRFSPTVLDSLPVIHRLQIPMLDPWAAADGIVDNGFQPNYVFRLSLRDSWAMQAMIALAGAKGKHRLGLLLLNTSWGRSNQFAAEQYVASHPDYRIAGIHWFNWNEESLRDKYLSLINKGAEAVLFVGNDFDAVNLVKSLETVDARQRLPIISHWGVTGGDFTGRAGKLLHDIDFSVVQTYSFIGKKDKAAMRVLAAAKRLFGVNGARELESPVGVAHAYDLTHILALAIDQAGVLDRSRIRDALERVTDYAGLIQSYARPFSPERHEALSAQNAFMAVYAPDNAIEPLPRQRRVPKAP
ncbi:MAG: ABC transporter substrate-binding protein [Methylococcaceae bacterium]|nr:MAG: ABC transporter substrate-binding protein [Methylococcaceae bacterium]